MKNLILTIVFVFTVVVLFSQTTARGIDSPESGSASLIEMDDSNWSFYSDEANRTYYIDFEKINVNLSDVIVKNENGEIVLKEDVLDLPVNTIYELDFNEWGNGTYHVELRSFTRIIRKKITIR